MYLHNLNPKEENMAEDLIKKADGTNYGTTMAGNFIHDIIDEDIKNQK